MCRIVAIGRSRRTPLGGRLVGTGLQEALDHRALDAGVDIVGRYGQQGLGVPPAALGQPPHGLGVGSPRARGETLDKGFLRGPQGRRLQLLAQLQGRFPVARGPRVAACRRPESSQSAGSVTPQPRPPEGQPRPAPPAERRRKPPALLLLPAQQALPLGCLGEFQRGQPRLAGAQQRVPASPLPSCPDGRRCRVHAVAIVLRTPAVAHDAGGLEGPQPPPLPGLRQRGLLPSAIASRMVQRLYGPPRPLASRPGRLPGNSPERPLRRSTERPREVPDANRESTSPAALNPRFGPVQGEFAKIRLTRIAPERVPADLATRGTAGTRDAPPASGQGRKWRIRTRRRPQARERERDPRQCDAEGPGRDTRWGMTARLSAYRLPIAPALAAAALLAAPSLAVAQASDRGGSYDNKTGLITPVPADEGGDVRVATTDTVPGMECEAVDAAVGQFPIMVLSTSGMIGGRTLADGAIRGMRTLRRAAAEAGANAVLGFRSEAYQTRNGNPRVFLYGTLVTSR